LLITGAVFIFAAASLLFQMNYRRAQTEPRWNESQFRKRFRLPDFAFFRRLYTLAALILLVTGAAFVLAGLL